MVNRKFLFGVSPLFLLWLAVSFAAIFLPSAGQAAILTCHIYDDQTGLAISGADFQITEAGGIPQQPPLTYTSNEEGKVSFTLLADSLVFDVVKAGYSTVTRKINISGDAGELLDVRLTPLGSPITLSPSQTSAAIDADSTLSVVGSIAESIEFQATIISPQGINFPLPLGWSPIFAIDLDTEAPLPIPQLKVTTQNKYNVTSADDPVLAFWDVNTHQWTAETAPVISPDSASVNLTIDQTGHYVLIISDINPIKPPIPTPGNAVQGVTFSFAPGDSIAAVAFNPLFVVSGGAYRSMAQVIVTTTVPVPSGYHLKTKFLENYTLTDGSEIVTPAYYQDIALYEYPTDGDRLTLTGLYPVTPR